MRFFRRRKYSQAEQKALTEAFIKEQAKMKAEGIKTAMERGRMLARGTARSQNIKRTLAVKAGKKIVKFLSEPPPIQPPTKHKKKKQVFRDPLEGWKV